MISATDLLADDAAIHDKQSYINVLKQNLQTAFPGLQDMVLTKRYGTEYTKDKSNIRYIEEENVNVASCEKVPHIKWCKQEKPGSGYPV